jgi:hypothetical protein
MTSQRFGRLMQWRAGAVLLLLVVGFAAPSTAWAGCNQLVGSRSDPFMKLDQLDALILVGSSSASRADSLHFPLGRPASPRRAPCSGPGCSNSKAPMPGSTITPVPEGRDRWVSLEAVVVDDNTPALPRTTEEPSLSSSGEKSSIFHPPRV